MADSHSTEEIWKAVPGFEGVYDVSTHGRVRSLHGQTPRLLVPSISPKGYHTVCLSRHNQARHWRVHRLVLMAFVGPGPRRYEGMHLDGNPANNRLSNLAWGTRKENHSHMLQHGTAPRGERHHAATLTAAMVREIRQRFARGEKGPAIATALGVGYSAVMCVKSGKTWSHTL